MTKLPFFLMMAVLWLCSCSPNTDIQEQLETAQAALDSVKQELAALQAEEKEEEIIIHTVYFKTKPNLSETDLNTFLAEIQKLQQIEVVTDLEIGTFLDVGDERALSDYGIVMQVGFAKKEDMDVYQQHPIHLGLKEKLGPWLAGPPAVHDFEVVEAD